MSRKKKTKKRRTTPVHRTKPRIQNKNHIPTPLIPNDFSGGLEPLTEDLIGELTEKGWDEMQLRAHMVSGGRYCRPRDTVIYPIEIDE